MATLNPDWKSNAIHIGILLYYYNVKVLSIKYFLAYEMIMFMLV